MPQFTPIINTKGSLSPHAKNLTTSNITISRKTETFGVTASAYKLHRACSLRLTDRRNARTKT